MDLSAFLYENVASGDVVEEEISKRFKDKNGVPVKWQFRAISEERNAELRKSCQKRVKVGNRIQVETDVDEYLYKLVAETVVFPNLKDAALQESWGVKGTTALLKKMLLPGEFGRVVQIVREVNGFDAEAFQELIDEAKN